MFLASQHDRYMATIMSQITMELHSDVATDVSVLLPSDSIDLKMTADAPHKHYGARILAALPFAVHHTAVDLSSPKRHKLLHFMTKTISLLSSSTLSYSLD